MEEDAQFAKKWLIDLKTGSHELEALILHGLRVDAAEIGLIRCNFVVPHHLSDRDGNWHVGAMTTLMDDVAAASILSYGRTIRASLDFNISYYSTAAIHVLIPTCPLSKIIFSLWDTEEVEIEAKAIGHKAMISSAIVTVKKKENGHLIALGREWFSTLNISPTIQLAPTSKL